jgi:hypothetical protein
MTMPASGSARAGKPKPKVQQLCSRHTEGDDDESKELVAGERDRYGKRPDRAADEGTQGSPSTLQRHRRAVYPGQQDWNISVRQADSDF